eukprot:TRINITY_DN10713_c0_g1_i1.p1 TRINITY_DN10713_c0_g1~~TRINITY_DN10713_c0_g1_i1.p1  ORF type:complete len:751 (-),score=189.35 TRINITY_DN10713_c0_g1_i1:248-2500(-)
MKRTNKLKCTMKPRKRVKRDSNSREMDENEEDEQIEDGNVQKILSFESEDDENNDNNDDDEEQQLQQQPYIYDLNRKIKQELAHPNIIQFYVNILKNYKQNSQQINHVVIKFLRRISHKDHLDLEPMLYQVSVLKVFLQILEDKSIQKNPKFFEVLYFCRKVTRNLMSYLLMSSEKENDKNTNDQINNVEKDEKIQQIVRQEISSIMMVELLFWKNAKDAEDVREEYRWKKNFQTQNFAEYNSDNNDDDDEINDQNNNNVDDDNINNNIPQNSNQVQYLTSQQQQLSQKLTKSLKQKILLSFDKHSGKKDWKQLILQDVGQRNLRQKDVVEFLKDQGLKKGRISRQQENFLLMKFAENQMREDVLEFLAGEIPGGYDAKGVKTLLTRLGVNIKKKKKQGEKRKRNNLNSINDVNNSQDSENQSENESENSDLNEEDNSSGESSSDDEINDKNDENNLVKLNDENDDEIHDENDENNFLKLNDENDDENNLRNIINNEQINVQNQNSVLSSDEIPNTELIDQKKDGINKGQSHESFGDEEIQDEQNLNKQNLKQNFRGDENITNNNVTNKQINDKQQKSVKKSQKNDQNENQGQQVNSGLLALRQKLYSKTLQEQNQTINHQNNTNNLQQQSTLNQHDNVLNFQRKQYENQEIFPGANSSDQIKNQNGEIDVNLSQIQLVEDQEVNNEQDEIIQDLSPIINKKRALIESDDEFENDAKISNVPQNYKDAFSPGDFQRVDVVNMSDQESDDL